MDIKLWPSRLNGTVTAPASKSAVHRALICAALADKPSAIIINAFSNDIFATAEALNSFGAVIKKTDDGMSVIPVNKDKRVSAGKVVFDCKESGSTMRFLIPVADALFDSYSFTGSKRLLERPTKPLTDSLENSKDGVYEIDGSVSSQFISGLLFMAPLKEADIFIKIKGESVSKPYIKMTTDVMKKYGIEVEETEEGYFVKGGQRYIAPEVFNAEGDWSNAAFWLCAGALGSGVNVCGLDPESIQGDRQIIDILRRIGAEVSEKEGSYTVKKGNLKAIELDASDIPDLVPAVSLVLALSEGTSRIYNAARLRLKESDRLMATANLLNSFGADVKETEDGLIIKGVSALKAADVSGQNDHRIVMTAAIASLYADGETVIRGYEAVNKSYPKFFDEFRALGGNFERTE